MRSWNSDKTGTPAPSSSTSRARLFGVLRSAVTAAGPARKIRFGGDRTGGIFPALSDQQEACFAPYRAGTVGQDQTFLGPYGERRIVYADWTASGRLYRPIEAKLLDAFGPFVGNTHSESSVTGTAMTLAYHEAHGILKRHVGDGPDDLIITCGSGMTAAVNKFQRILGLKAPERLRGYMAIPEAERPVVFVTHMEHPSTHTSWYETVGDVVVVPPDGDGVVDLAALEALLHQYPLAIQVAFQ